MDWGTGLAWLLAPGGVIALAVGWMVRHRVARRVGDSWLGRRINAERRLIQVREERDATQASLERREAVWHTERDEILARLKRREDAWAKERAELTTQVEWLILSLERLTLLSDGLRRVHERTSRPESAPSSRQRTRSAANSPPSSPTSTTTRTSST